MFIEFCSFGLVVTGLLLLLTGIQCTHSYIDSLEDKLFVFEYEVVDDSSIESYELIGESIVHDDE